MVLPVLRAQLVRLSIQSNQDATKLLFELIAPRKVENSHKKGTMDEPIEFVVILNVADWAIVVSEDGQLSELNDLAVGARCMGGH